MCELLLRNGANVNHSDKRDRRPLHWAASRNHEDVLQLLLRHNADLDLADKDGFTPLHAAAAAGADAVIQLLLEEGADVEAANNVRILMDNYEQSKL